MFSFTLQVKSEGYVRTRSTRVFLCASSPDESGREALDWSLETLVQDGDELIVYRGVYEDVLGVSRSIFPDGWIMNMYTYVREGPRYHTGGGA